MVKLSFAIALLCVGTVVALAFVGSVIYLVFSLLGLLREHVLWILRPRGPDLRDLDLLRDAVLRSRPR